MSPSTFVRRHNRRSPNNYRLLTISTAGRVIKRTEGPADETLSPSDVEEAWSRQASGASRRGTRSPGRRHQQITLTTVSSWRRELWALDTRLKAETKAAACIAYALMQFAINTNHWWAISARRQRQRSATLVRRSSGVDATIPRAERSVRSGDVRCGSTKRRPLFNASWKDDRTWLGRQLYRHL